jgi:uncharacterized BrkB/YihY/UPF0761 family membrane protein
MVWGLPPSAVHAGRGRVVRRTVIYVKSVLAGLFALIVVPMCVLVILVVAMVIYALVHPTSGEGSIGWDPISLVHTNPIVWSIPVLIFLMGFTWEYRRLAK